MRITKLRKKMTELGLDAVIVLDELNQHYLSEFAFTDGLLYFGGENADCGSDGIKGEFSENGVTNKIPTKKGYVILNRGSDFDSGYGQFGILTKNNSSLSGKYAVFGRVTDMSVIDNMIKSLEVNSNGHISEATAPRITLVSVHSSDSHDH